MNEIVWIRTQIVEQGESRLLLEILKRIDAAESDSRHIAQGLQKDVSEADTIGRQSVQRTKSQSRGQIINTMIHGAALAYIGCLLVDYLHFGAHVAGSCIAKARMRSIAHAQRKHSRE